MYYIDSDDSDGSDQYVFGMGYHHNYYDYHHGHGWDIDDSDYGGFYGGYESDDFEFDSDMGSYTSTVDNFHEISVDPSLFPDTSNFCIENARRISRIENCNRQSIMALADTSILEKMKNPSFEHLWESLYYLRELIDVGRKRSDGDCNLVTKGSYTYIGNNNNNNGLLYVNNNIQKIYDASVSSFSKLSPKLLDVPNNWFVWCNDMLIDKLQKLIPFPVPYTAWKSIITHLSAKQFSKNRELLTNMQTLSTDEELQIIEREFIQNCTQKCIELTKNFYMVLFSNQPMMFHNKSGMIIPKLLQVLNTMMLRLSCFFESTTPISRCMNYKIRKEGWAFLEDIENYSIEEDLDLSKLVRANVDFRYNSVYFALLSINNSKPNTFNLICFDKRFMDDPENLKLITINDAVCSNDVPALYCCGNLVAVISTKKKEKTEVDKLWQLTFWDIGISKERLSTYNLNNLQKIYGGNAKEVNLNGINEIHNVGVVRTDNIVTVSISVKFAVKDEEGSAPCCYILKFDLGKGKKKKHKSKPPSVGAIFTNALLLSVNKNFVFVVHYESEHVLCLHDMNQNYKILTMIKWDNEVPWHIRFNSNPENDTCLLYNNRSEMQIRKLDERLTFVKDVHINLESNELLSDPEFQFYDNIICGHRGHCPQYDAMVQNMDQEELTKLTLLNSKLSVLNSDFKHMSFPEALLESLKSNFFTVDQYFCIDLDNMSGDRDALVYFDTFGDDTTVSSEEFASGFKINFTGFNKNGDLLQMVMAPDPDTCNLDVDDELIDGGCSELHIVVMEFLENFKDVTDSMLPDAKKILTLYKEKAAAEEVRVKKEQEVQKQLEEAAKKQREEAAKKREERRQKDAELSRRRPERMKSAQKAIDTKSRYTSTISAWFSERNYGFTNVCLEGTRGSESVFVHGSSVLTKKNRCKLHRGAKIEFEIKWDSSQPRPKAVNVRVV